MFRTKNIIIFFFLVNAPLYAQKGQSWISRVWHNSVSHYNYYYNANVLVTDVKEETMLSYKDNYKDVLSLYPITDEASLKGNAAKMDEAIKKCSNIIDKHGKSKWVDDTYLLMGDAHMYKGSFYSAIEVYEYLAGVYKNTPPALQAQINLIVLYLQMKKYEDAEALYTKLAGQKDFPPKLKTQLEVAGAAVNIKQGKYAVAIKLLEQAIPNVKIKAQKVRYNFVLAQLYGLTKNNQQATVKYKKVIKLNPPYEFAFNARLNMAKAINPKNRGEVKNAKAILREMLKDDKNIDYFDQIYFELGNLEIADKNESQAIVEYRNALSSKSNDMGIKSSSYLALADLYFRHQNYEEAQVYYDSAARTVDPSHPDYQAIQDKNLVLNDLIKHLINIREKDSLLKLSLPENKALLEKTIDKLIQQKKDQAEFEKQNQEIQKFKQENIQQQAPQTGGNFPFYNQAALTKGIQDFNRIWVNRSYSDFWGIESLQKEVIYKRIDSQMKSNDIGDAVRENLIKNASDERKEYYKNIPFTNMERDQLKNEIAEAYFLAANIYYQDLKEYDKARHLLDELNRKYPGNKYQLNSWYLLARMARDQKDAEKEKYYTDLIRKTDSTSNFLDVLANKGQDSTAIKASGAAEKEVEMLYAKMFNAYKAKNYDEAMSYKKENDTKFPGSPLQINFDYLEALILGEKGMMKEFQAKLQAIVDNYPETPIAKQSLQTIDLLKARNGEKPAQAEATNKYRFDNTAEHFYMLLVPKGIDMTPLKLAYLNFNKSFYPSDGLKVTQSLLGDQYQILIVNNFKSFELAKAYIVQMTSNKQFFADLKLNDPIMHYLISRDNFSILITDKVLNDYLAFYKTNYQF